ncbi:hypothetical protein [Nostoc sp. FACHB-152]|nr:hypothetical protein [Nostoc sp. FACHB-152]
MVRKGKELDIVTEPSHSQGEPISRCKYDKRAIALVNIMSG